MARKDIGVGLNRDNRNAINHNFIELYKGQSDYSAKLNQVEQNMSDKMDNFIEDTSNAALDKVIDNAKLDWLNPVDSYDKLPKDAKKGNTVMTRDNGYVYRFDGEQWNKIQEIDAGPVNELDSRLSQQLDSTNQQLASKANDWINVKSFGAMGDGITDDTKAINDCIIYCSENKKDVFFPNATFLVSVAEESTHAYEQSIILKSNMNIYMSKNTVIKKAPTDKSMYHIFSIVDVENINIFGNGAKVIGDRENHNGTTGEHGMGFGLVCATNIYIENLEARECWGDGLYIGRWGSSLTKMYSENIHVRNFTGDYNRRQGISIASGKDILIESSALKNTIGTPPEAGIIIEPNGVLDHIDNIILRDIYTENNVGDGIEIYAGFFDGSENVMTILIENHHDIGSGYGFRPTRIGTSEGRIIARNCLWESPKNNAFYADRWGANNPPVELYNCTAKNVVDAEAFKIGAPAGQTGEIPYGNVHIHEPSVIGGTPIRGILVYTQGVPASKVSIIDPIKLPDLTNAISTITPCPSLVFTDKYRQRRRLIEWGTLVEGNRLYRYFDNKDRGLQSKLTLAKRADTVDSEITITNIDGTRIDLELLNGCMIYPITTTGDTVVRNEQKGATISIRFDVEGHGHVTNMVGNWIVPTV